jgi:hypothetical protein
MLSAALCVEINPMGNPRRAIPKRPPKGSKPTSRAGHWSRQRRAATSHDATKAAIRSITLASANRGA